MTALSAFAQAALALDPEGQVSLVIFFATLALYNLDGSVDASALQRSARRRNAHLALTVGAGLLCAALALGLPHLGRALLLGGMLICGSYALPLGPTGSSLKKLTGFKAPFVGLSVAVATVGLPTLCLPDSAEPPAWSATAWSIAILGLCSTQNALLFDIPDILEDRRQRIPTLPALLGHRATRAIGVGLLCAAGGLLFAAPAGIPSTAKLGLWALCAALLVGTFTVGPLTKKATVALTIDGALILPWAVMNLRP